MKDKKAMHQFPMALATSMYSSSERNMNVAYLVL